MAFEALFCYISNDGIQIIRLILQALVCWDSTSVPSCLKSNFSAPEM